MNRSRSVDDLKGVQVTTVTPFDQDGVVDTKAIHRNARFLVDRGIRVLIPCGNTGEFNALTLGELEHVVEATVEAVGDDATVIASAGYDTKTAISLGRAAKAAGAYALMLHHPHHTFTSPEGLLRYYTTIADALDIGVIIYKRNHDVPDAIIERLVRHDNIVSVKYAIGDIDRFSAICARTCDAKVLWSCGSAERWAPFFHLAGAAAYTSGIANFAPDLTLSMWQALHQRRFDDALAIRTHILPFEELRAHAAYNVPAVKEAMRQLGTDSGIVREPLSGLPENLKQNVASILETWKYSSPFSLARETKSAPDRFS